MCSSRLPPIVTFSSCMPAPMPNTGMRRSAMIRISRRSNISRRAASGRIVGCSIQPSRRGSRSAPPTSTTPSTRCEDLLQIFVALERRNDERNAAHLADRVVVARRDVRESGLVARGVREIGIQTNDWLRPCHCTPLFGVVRDAWSRVLPRPHCSRPLLHTLRCLCSPTARQRPC